MHRRRLIALGAAAAAWPALGWTEAAVMLSGPLVGSLYFTREEPGLWASEAARHVPRIDISQAPGGTTSVTISTPHPMEGCSHYIIRHKLLDARLRLLSQRTFDPKGERPLSQHVLPAGYQGPIYAVSLCNLHDAWIEGVMIGGDGPAPGL